MHLLVVKYSIAFRCLYKKNQNHLLDHPTLSCNDVSAWMSTIVVRERRLVPQRTQQEAVPTGPTKGSTEDVIHFF